MVTRYPGACGRCGLSPATGGLSRIVTAITQQAHGPGEQEDDHRQQSQFR
ncbi:MAG: hypothetical protein WBM52_06760 [Thiogranum sp.]